MTLTNSKSFVIFEAGTRKRYFEPTLLNEMEMTILIIEAYIYIYIYYKIFKEEYQLITFLLMCKNTIQYIVVHIVMPCTRIPVCLENIIYNNIGIYPHVLKKNFSGNTL